MVDYYVNLFNNCVKLIDKLSQLASELSQNLFDQRQAFGITTQQEVFKLCYLGLGVQFSLLRLIPQGVFNTYA